MEIESTPTRTPTSTVRLWARAFRGGARMQVRMLRREPGHLLTLITSPLFAVLFLSIAVHSGDRQMLVNAVLAPGLMALWLLAVSICGGLVNRDRWSGALELALAMPAPLLASVLGRIGVTLILAVLAIGESVLVAWLGFGVRLTVHHPVLLGATVVLTLAAMAATASLFSGLFVLSRALLLFQNAMTYPFYVLGGVVVPASVLPTWLAPVSDLVFLSWSADLLRDCLYSADPVPDAPVRLLVIGGLAIVTLACGALLTGRIAVRVARTGSAGAS